MFTFLYFAALFVCTLYGFLIANVYIDDPGFKRKHYLASVLFGLGIGMIPVINAIGAIILLVLTIWFVCEVHVFNGKWLNEPASKKNRV